MKRFPFQKGKPRLLSRSSFIANSGFLRTGVFSLFLHSLLIFFVIFSLNPVHKKDGMAVYRVTLQTFLPHDESGPSAIQLPIPGKTQIRKEENSPKQELRQREAVLEKKNSDSEIRSPAQIETSTMPPEEQKQIPRSQEKEQAPIPLSIGELLPSDRDSNSKMEDSPSVPSALSRHEEQKQNIIPGTGYGGGQGQGALGGGGSGVGSGTGKGGSAGDSGSGSGQGTFVWGESGKGAGIGGAGSGSGGSGDGSGTGRGGSGGGGSGGYGTAVILPKYGENPKPVYPQEARARGYKGKVLLKVEVLPNGRVRQIEIKQSSGHEILDQSALSTVREWKFIPAQKGGVAISSWLNIPVKFDLQ